MNTYIVSHYFNFDKSSFDRIRLYREAIRSFPESWTEIPFISIIRTAEGIDAVRRKLASFPMGEGDKVVIIEVECSDLRAIGKLSKSSELLAMIDSEFDSDFSERLVSHEEPVPAYHQAAHRLAAMARKNAGNGVEHHAAGHRRSSPNGLKTRRGVVPG